MPLANFLRTLAMGLLFPSSFIPVTLKVMTNSPGLPVLLHALTFALLMASTFSFGAVVVFALVVFLPVVFLPVVFLPVVFLPVVFLPVVFFSVVSFSVVFFSVVFFSV